MLNGYRVLPLWYFNCDKENITNTLRITESLNNKHEIQNKLSLNNNVIGLPQSKWYGCFGSQSYINYDFLLQINKKYKYLPPKFNPYLWPNVIFKECNEKGDLYFYYINEVK